MHVVPEAKLEQTAHGLVPQGDGWFVLGLRDAGWRHAEGRGAVCVVLDDFENVRRPVQLGLNPFVLEPGEPMAMYHWEGDQEDFLVVSGEAVQARASRWTRSTPASRMRRVRRAGRSPIATAGLPARPARCCG
jgi:hypothetical protein